MFGLGELMAPVVQMVGAERANQNNRQLARNATNASAIEAEKNRDFQERLASNSRQREIADLKAAGLNPLLTSSGGAATPGGAMGTPSMAREENPFSGLSATALELSALKMAAEKQKEDIELTRAQKGKTQMETKVMSKGIPEADIKNSIWESFKPYIKKVKESLTPSAPKPIKNNLPKDWKNNLGNVYQKQP